MNTCKSKNNFYWAYVDISYFDEIVRWVGEEFEGTYFYIRPFINIIHLPIEHLIFIRKGVCHRIAIEREYFKF